MKKNNQTRAEIVFDEINEVENMLSEQPKESTHITWWKGLNEEEQTKLCQKHFQGIPVESLMERSIKVMYHYENPETTTNTVTGEIKLWVTGSGVRSENLTANDVLIRTDDATIHLDKDSEFGKLAHAMIDRYNGHDKIKEENLMLLNAIHDAYDNLLMGNTEAAGKGLSKALSTIEPNKY